MIALAIEKRLHASRALRAAVTLGSLSLALFLGGAVIAAVGVNPCGAYAALCRGAFGTSYGLSETVVKAIPLLFCGLSVSLALRMRLWNIGAEGQYVVGALAASLVALVIPGLGRVSYFALMLLASFAAGALWGGIPGALRARLNVSEIITTLLINWVALALVIFGNWHPGKATLGALLFGALYSLDTRLQARGTVIPVQFLQMIPYLGTIAFLALAQGKASRRAVGAPEALGRPYFREEKE